MIRTALTVVAFASVFAGQPAAARDGPTDPKAYVVGEFNVKDPVAYKSFKATIGPIVAKYGGRYLVRGGKVAEFEGAVPTGIVIVIEFDSFVAAEAFEHSAENRAVAALRRQASDAKLFIVQGIAP